MQATTFQVDDEERSRLILKMILRLKDIEEEFKPTSSNTADRHSLIGGSTSHNFYKTGIDSNSMYHQAVPPPPAPPSYVTFRPVKELLNTAAPSLAYAKSYAQIENSELLYKIFRGETRLVRSVLEGNGFEATESHDWNVLWSNSGCKSYLYEGLNEYQKVNHFPSSNEITRKDKLC